MSQVVYETKITRKARVKPQSKLDALLDDIKDEIDALGDLRSKKQCREGAKDLIDYIERHYLYRGEGGY